MLNRILSFYTKYFAIWVVIFAGIACFFPDLFLAVKGGMSWFFALTMFGIGVVLEPADFKRIAKKPAVVAIGCCAQFVIMPFGAFLLARAFGQ